MMSRILSSFCNNCSIVRLSTRSHSTSHYGRLHFSKSVPVISHHFVSPQRFLLTGQTSKNSLVILKRLVHSQQDTRKRSTVYYSVALLVLVTGLSYAAVPLYRMFCQATAYGGTLSVGHDVSKILENPAEARRDRMIRVRFNADTASSMTWNFKPQQSELTVPVGETALAFYTAKNPTDKPVDGISTYNVIPFEAGQYFNKIQCFCFEEQRLNPNEQVDLPVFFYIDPEFVEDPKMEGIDSIVLSYTFFEAKDTEKFANLPIFQHNRK